MLFATMIDVMRTAGFDGKKVKSYDQALNLISTAATLHSSLSPIAREDPELRASAAQMLVACFGGHGVTTPQRKIGAIPSLDGPSRSEAPRKKHSDRAKYRVKKDNRRRPFPWCS